MANKLDEIPAPTVGGSKDYLRYSEGLLNVSSRQVSIRTAISTVIFFGVLWGLKLGGAEDLPVIGAVLTLFLERSLIQYVSTLTFFFGMWFVILKFPVINKESSGFSLLEFPELTKWPYGAETAAVVSGKIRSFSPERKNLAIVRRFDTALQRLVHTHDTSQVHDVLNTMSDIDREIADASYRSVRFAVWFIPVAGFLGTVLGISRAISGFAGVVSGEGAMSLSAVRPMLASATFSLGIAFDTTLLALVLSAILMMAMYAAQRREEVFLSAVDEFCISEVVNKIFVPDPGVSKILGGIQELTERMVNSVGELSNTMRSDFSELIKSMDKQDEDRIPKLIETIQARFESFMDSRDKSENVFQTQLSQLLSHLGNIVDRGKAVEGFVAGLGEVANLSNILQANLEAIETMQGSFEKLQAETGKALTEQQKQTKIALTELAKQTQLALAEIGKETRVVLEEQQKQTRTALEQNKLAFDQLLPPLKELSTGIKIKVGD